MRLRYCLPAAMLSLLLTGAVAKTASETSIPSHDVSQQDNVKEMRGNVSDRESSEPVSGAVVSIQGTSCYSITDEKGNFTLKVPANLVNEDIEISMLGYTTRYIRFSEAKVLVKMQPEAEFLNESQVIAYGKQSKMSITGSIVSIDTKELLKSPSGSVANTLAGALTGVSSIQTSGQPGAEDPVIYVRGTGSLTDESSSPLILVDGVERSFFQMDPNEIESITVLKDAASTAVFGVRGANGVILVTTRRGESGKPTISITSSGSITQPLRNLTGVDSYTYATLYTEAQRNDNPAIRDSDLTFSPYITEMFRTNEDPIIFPNVDWNEYIFKDLAWQTQHNITMSGGGERFKYFISFGYLHQDGILKHLGENYDPNYKYDRYNYRANVDINLTKTTLMKINAGGYVGKNKSPRTDQLWRKVMWSVPFSSPGLIDGKWISNANSKYIPLGEKSSGLDYYYNWGYSTKTDNYLNLDLSIEQNLDFLTKGLSFTAKGAYNTNYYVTVTREPTGIDSKYFPMYLGTVTQPGMDISDPRFDKTIIYQTDGVHGLDEPLSYSESYGKGRNWYLEFSFNYARTFGKHEISALLLYNQSKTYYPSTMSDIPTGYVGYVGRITYSFSKKYLLDFNVGYNGSENFAPDKRFGLFPAGSIGWIISEEKFMKRQNVIDFLKLRASYGLVGNDKYSGERFLYLGGSWSGNNAAWPGKGSYQFGADATGTLQYDAKENTVGNPDVTWEKVAKQNYGLDLKLFNYRLSLTADVFFEQRRDILSTRNTLPSITDIQLPLINLGIVYNQGYEVSLGWNDSSHAVGYYITANLSYSRNKIIFMDEIVPEYSWMAQTGRSTGLTYGYLFDRFLTSEDFDENGEFKDNIPEMAGTFRPGDALFKDLNEDGVIDGYDKTWFGHSQRPDYVAGLLAGISWKNFSVSMQWSAGIGASRLLEGEYRNPFGSINSRMLLKFIADNRWTEETQDNARFPRLTFTNKTHYLETSDLWLIDASYLRLKTAEISYTFTDNLRLKKAGISSLKLFINGYNLLTLFSDLNKLDIDPEGGTQGDTNTYPNIRIFNLGVNLTF